MTEIEEKNAAYITGMLRDCLCTDVIFWPKEEIADAPEFWQGAEWAVTAKDRYGRRCYFTSATPLWEPRLKSTLVTPLADREGGRWFGINPA